MSISSKLKVGGSKVLRTAMAGVVAVGLMPLPAFAADLQATSLVETESALTVQAESSSMSIDGLVLGDAFAAANPAPEILGLSNPSQRSTKEGDTTYEYFGNPELNSNPDPFLYNSKNGGTPSYFLNTHSGSPMSALQKYGSTSAVNSVWNLAPHVILGTGSDTAPANEHDFYDSADYARAAETANGWESNSYHPIGVTYNRTTLPTMIATMYRLANAANEAIEESGGELQVRYGDPLEIAKNYERYALGQKGLVKQAIDTGKVDKKTIAVVSGYDNGSFTIITDGVAEGTATTNRWLEAVQGVTNNYYDTVGVAGSTQVSADDLKNNVDFIIINSNSGQNKAYAEISKDTDLLAKTYYCTDINVGAAFQTTVNSVENSQNIGRILPCVYPTVLKQSDMIAYYYDTFYHVKDGKLGSMINAKMDGVRNWTVNGTQGLTDWSEETISGYVHDDVQQQLQAGVAYLNSQSGLSAYLTPTDYLADDSAGAIDLDSDTTVISVSASTLTNGKAEPEPVVSYGGTTLTKGTDYTVAWSNNTSVGATGTVTITGTGSAAGGYYGSKSATFKVVESENFKDGTSGTVTVALAQDSYTYSGETFQPAVTVTLNEGGSTLTKGTDYTVSYANNKNAGQATVTVTGIGNYLGTVTAHFTIANLSPTLAWSKKPGATVNYSKNGAFSAEAAIDKAYTVDNGEIAYASSDPTVISYDAKKGFVIEKPGTTTITATAAATTNCKAAKALTQEVTVSAVGKQTISAKSDYLNADTYTYTVTFGAATFSLGLSSSAGGDLKYESNNKSVATIDEKGNVTMHGVTNDSPVLIAVKAEAVGSGNTVYAGASDPVQYKLTINKLKAQTVTIEGAPTGAVSKPAGSTYSLRASTDGDGAITYASSNEDVATVSNTGIVTMKKTGQASITAEAASTDNAGAGTSTCTIKVTPGTVKAPTGATLTYNGAAQTGVAAGTGYTVTNGTATNAGSYTATVALTDKDSYTWADGTTADKTVAWKINPASLASAKVTLSDTSFEANGSAQKPTVKSVTLGSATVPAAGYTVAYENANSSAVGTYKVTVTGKGNYTGSASASYTITGAAPGTKVEDVTVSSGVTADATVNSDGASVTLSNVSKTAKKVSIDTVTVNGEQVPVTVVAANALKSSKATSITIGDSVVELGASALAKTTKLKTLTIGKGLTKVGKNVLKGSKVKKVTLKSSNLNKSNFKKLFKGSKVKTVKLKGVSKKAKKNYKKWAKALKIKVK